MDLTFFIHRLETEFPIVHEPVEEHPQTAAVLVILFRKFGKEHVLLIKRAENLRMHAGEISFPGGVFETEDETLLQTALRETQEELNLEIEESQVIGRLTTVTTRTEFQVTPYVAVVDTLPPYKINRREVAEAIEAPLVTLLSTHHRDVGYSGPREMVAYFHKKHRVWGATARILHEIGRLCQLL